MAEPSVRQALDAQQAVDGAHRVGRRIFRWHLIIVVAATVVASLAVWQDRLGSDALGDLGGLLASLAPLGISMFIGRFESIATQRAAALQDEFDRSSLGLPPGLPLDQPSEADRARLRAASNAPTEKLTHWYPDLTGRDPGAAALAIQRMNLRCDVPQRRSMSGVSLGAGFVWLLVGLALWGQSTWAVADFVLIWMGPAVAVWELSISSAYRHWGLAQAKKALASVADSGLSGDWQGRGSGLGLADAIQTQLTQFRSEAPRVPPMVANLVGKRHAAQVWASVDDAAPVAEAGQNPQVPDASMSQPAGSIDT